jgi:ABC-type branched-subunit amino acid transport system ATPase component
MALLEIDRISKRFGGLQAVNDVSFSIDAGELAFVVGPNGAGKTTLFNLISGVFRPDQGRLRFKGADITGLSPYQTARLGIGRTFQIVKPLRTLTVLENVMLGAFMHTASPTMAAERATEVLAFLEMDHVARVVAGGLPLPMLKRLEIARALATKPALILLDEVVAGLSTAEAVALAEILKRLPARGVAAVGGVEHVMRVVMSLATRVIVLDHGTEIAQGPPEVVVRTPAVIEAYLGTKYRELGL